MLLKAYLVRAVFTKSFLFLRVEVHAKAFYKQLEIIILADMSVLNNAFNPKSWNLLQAFIL